ncbi:MAG: hypothetical protein J6386_20600 [Candidatus Synoicihabitans palmerolidicus]|nr:hypothetical protein [Candidatus Synoicihabitans palmerolidicus]
MDGAGDLWVELGTGRVARISPTLPLPSIYLHGPGGEMESRWPNIFIFEAEARINVPDDILRLNPQTHQLSLDSDLMDRFPAIKGAMGRPTEDALGRLWVTQPDQVKILNFENDRAFPSGESISDDLRPLHYFPQSDGVMWLQ